MPLPRRLSTVTLGADDVGRLRDFYRAWGWESDPAWDSDTYAAFSLDGIEFCLFPRDLLVEEARPGEVPPPEADRSNVVLSIKLASRDEVERVLADAVAAGATALSSCTERDWGGYSGYVADPEGNRWELVWSPHSAVGGS